MNKEEIIKALNNLIEDFNDYSTDYTKTACIYYKEIFIEIKKQLEEKDKIINEAIEFIRNGEDGKGQFYKCCVRKVSMKEDEELLEILERDKEVK